MTPLEAIQRIARIPANLRAAIPNTLDECQKLVIEDVERNFEQGISPDGEPWDKRKDKHGWPLLIKSTALYSAAVGTGPGHVSENDGRRMATGVSKDGGPESLEGAMRQNYGFRGPDSLGRKINTPAREFEGATPATIDKMENKVADAFMDGGEAPAF